jgi:hypothetical protein
MEASGGGSLASSSSSSSFFPPFLLSLSQQLFLAMAQNIGPQSRLGPDGDVAPTPRTHLSLPSPPSSLVQPKYITLPLPPSQCREHPRRSHPHRFRHVVSYPSHSQQQRREQAMSSPCHFPTLDLPPPPLPHEQRGQQCRQQHTLIDTSDAIPLPQRARGGVRVDLPLNRPPTSRHVNAQSSLFTPLATFSTV